MTVCNFQYTVMPVFRLFSKKDFSIKKNPDCTVRVRVSKTYIACVHSTPTLSGTCVQLHIHTNIQSANRMAATQCT